jgi:type II secretion system protein G
MKKSRQAVTLIELLIVVAIIGILASIAVPNFMDAQVRAKISRTKADMKTVADALSLYFLDHQKFPPDNAPYQPYRIPNNLTTPVSFLHSIPRDVFRGAESEDPSIPNCVWQRFVYQSFLKDDVHNGCGSVDLDTPRYIYGAWVMNSIGPDQKYSGYTEYAVSNGITSSGDVIRSAKHQEQQSGEPM